MYTESDEPASEPIAIIGISCKFSGGASNPENLWNLMAAGKTGWGEIPKSRYNLAGIYHSNHERTSTTHVKGAHFLDEDVAAFDAAFFSYSAEMAQAVDPQFRMQLESTYEALENAGLPLSQVAGSRTSVFAGVFTHDYHEGIIRDEDRLPRFNVVGTWSPMSSNRISHFFDFRGASMTLETGCSTTLVALHQAVQTLQSREADMSIVTGANVMLNPDTFKVIGSLGMLSPDGRSYAFDSRANGYGRGEGVATIIVKRLSDAIANRDPIRAVIRGTALNQDGKTDTITTPSGAAQVELMQQCYQRAGLDPRGTQYFEAHGTGTPSGDPIEAGAMAAVFSDGEGRENEEYYLRVGSVKTNVGHTEAASGLAAMVKGVLCLEKGLIPPTVNLETPNSKLRLDEWRLRLVRTMEEWPGSLIDGPRRMSINNFGYGGANAHVILESADPWTLTTGLDQQPQRPNSNGYTNGNGHANNSPHLHISNGFTNGNGHSNDSGHLPNSFNDEAKVLIVSARDERGCLQLVSDLKRYLQSQRSNGEDVARQLIRNLSYTLCERRTLFSWVAGHQMRLDKDNLLHSAIEALDSPQFKPVRRGTDRPRIGMVFTGQGAQWYAMGRELLTSYPVFRRSIDEADSMLRDLGADWSLLDELMRDKSTTRVHATNISIPICVALQIALVKLLKSWDIVHTAVVSHSSGEIAAAYAVGALTHRQAIAIAYWRAALVADETMRPTGAAKGAMAAVGLGVEAVRPYLDTIKKDDGRAVVACINSPESVTISGDDEAVRRVEASCAADGVFSRRLKVQQAYHSHHMDPFASHYRERLRIDLAHDVNNTGKKHVPHSHKKQREAVFSSAVTGGRVTDFKQLASPEHWVRSLVGPVEFVDAFIEMVLGDAEDPTGRSVDVLLEVGPHPALGGPVKEILSLPEFGGMDLPYWGCLVRDQHAGDSMRAVALNLLRKGAPLAISQINFPLPEFEDERPQVLTDLPSYPWNHTMRFWQESRVNKAINERTEAPHELLGMRLAGADPSSAIWRRVLRVSETPWVRDHTVQGSIVYPGSAYICHAIEAAQALSHEDKSAVAISGFHLKEVEFLFACVIPDSAEGVEIRTTLRRVIEQNVQDLVWYSFEVSSVTLDNRWTLHSKGMVMAECEMSLPKSAEIPPLSTYTRQPDPSDLFANLRARNIYHGPLFQNTSRIIQDGRAPRSLCDVTIRHEASADTDALEVAKRTVLHPITLDAIVVAFYTALPSVGALQDDPKLPRSVSSMWVSKNTSREVGHTLRCHTDLLSDDAESGTANITVIDSRSGVMALQIQGVEFSSLGRGTGATARQDAKIRGDTIFTPKWEQELVSKVVWGPDLSIRNPLALSQIQKELSARSSTAVEQLAALLGRILHKNPIAKVLQIGSSTATRRTLETIGLPLVGEWHVTQASTGSLELTRSELEDWAHLLTFAELNIEESLSNQNFILGSYDVVVSFEALGAAKSTSNAIANVLSLLRPGGMLLFEDMALTRDEVSWDGALREAGFNGIDLEFLSQDHATVVSMATVPAPEQIFAESCIGDNFALVSSVKTDLPPGFVDLLSQRLEGLAGRKTAHLILEESSLDLYKGKICIFLGEIQTTILADLDLVTMEGLRAMVTQCDGLLWVTTGGSVTPEQSLHRGLLRVLRNEHIDRRFLSLDLDPTCATERLLSGGDDIVTAITQVVQEAFTHAEGSSVQDFEYAERDSVLHVPRHYKDEQYNSMITGPSLPILSGLLPLPTNKPDTEGAATRNNFPLEPLFQGSKLLKLELGIPGHLDTMAFVGHEEDSFSLSSGFIEIAPRAFGLQSRDVLVATGQELAGVITGLDTEGVANGFKIGDRVMALSAGTPFSNRVQVPWHAVVKIPDDLDFSTAASVPLAYTLAYIALVHTARLGPKQSVLIHAAAGATGQAAIMLAKHSGATEIYATAGTPEERKLLQTEYDMPAKRIFNSRDTSFIQGILTATSGHGVNVVFGSHPGLQASLSVVAPLGHLFHIGQHRVTDSVVTMKSFSRGVSMIHLDIPTLMACRSHDIQHALGEIANLIKQEVVRPVQPIALFPAQEVQTAFRLMQSDEQRGATVLRAQSDEMVHVVPRPRGACAQARLQPEASYLIVGGVGGIGRSIVHWMISRGAKHLVLLSRSAGELDLEKNKDTDGALFVREIREMGCRVLPISCDISVPSALTKAIRACQDVGLPPIRGVVQGAMLLRDSVFEQMTLEAWNSGLAPKLYGSWNLHTEFSQPESLDFFVILSSVSGIVGITSQANYAAGNSYEDALARWRQSRGLPGVAIDLGPISDIGYVSTSSKVADRLRKDGDFAMLDEDIVLRALNVAITHPLNSNPQIVIGLNSSPGPQWDPRGRSQLSRDARFIALRPRSELSSSTEAEPSGATLSYQLSSAPDEQVGGTLIANAIAAKLADIFTMPEEEIDLGKPPGHYGVDSLVAVELRNMLVLQAAADVSIFNVLQASSLTSLGALAAAKSRLLHTGP